MQTPSIQTEVIQAGSTQVEVVQNDSTPGLLAEQVSHESAERENVRGDATGTC